MGGNRCIDMQTYPIVGWALKVSWFDGKLAQSRVGVKYRKFRKKALVPRQSAAVRRMQAALLLQPLRLPSLAS